MNGTIPLVAGAAAFLLSAAAIVPLRRLALRWDLTDRPGGNKAHARPTPYLGGVAIVLATVVPATAVLGLADRRITAILLAATAIALLGLIDDIGSLSMFTRLAVETATASGVVFSGVQITLTGGWVDGAVTVVWIVVMTNSFNLLDNMDGTLGAVTTVAAAFLAGTAFVSAQPALGLLLTLLAYASLGFLLHNWPPARIFMGDSGALFIGFVLSCSAIVLVTGQDPGAMVSGLLLPTFIATVDTGVVFISRMRVGRSPLAGGTDHVSHRLRRVGFGTRVIAMMLGMITAFAGALCLAVALKWIPAIAAAITGGGTALLLIILLQGVSVYSPFLRSKAHSRIPERLR
ncbi:MraY family glycosyltransferase [Streptosporangium sp. NBC_01756]|uniref:MraY family glycosyltransferase n=1 Tax=Streptosporangium sp. NBC_01756 TaxID=2975950 RepID=UPI002DD8CD0C|nr:MraY family glycosyltransferase [Streptosporangium sp. NBC_01756]WSC87617.1 undecaprenyl/decaprenyl-phosphate alpha-N-acetylglucosaminyl 1-phosphate transferase [Streptosporangium sp. NBC_01756]